MVFLCRFAVICAPAAVRFLSPFFDCLSDLILGRFLDPGRIGRLPRTRVEQVQGVEVVEGVDANASNDRGRTIGLDTVDDRVVHRTRVDER